LNFSSLLENPTLFWHLLWPLAFPAGRVFCDFHSLLDERVELVKFGNSPINEYLSGCSHFRKE
jgi:hypothetical protein